jgi:hypothetical protein
MGLFGKSKGAHARDKDPGRHRRAIADVRARRKRWDKTLREQQKAARKAKGGS